MFYKMNEKTLNSIAKELNKEFPSAGTRMKAIIEEKKWEVEIYHNVIS